jgi:hypothetical protein
MQKKKKKKKERKKWRTKEMNREIWSSNRQQTRKTLKEKRKKKKEKKSWFRRSRISVLVVCCYPFSIQSCLSVCPRQV